VAVGEMALQLSYQFIAQVCGLGHEVVGQRYSGLLSRLERRWVVQCLGGEFLIEAVLLGNCRAKRQSAMAAVVASTSEPDELGGDGVELVESDRRSLPIGQSRQQSWVSLGPSGYANRAGAHC
jgi:hypothetical protein